MNWAEFDALYRRRHEPEALNQCVRAVEIALQTAPDEFEWLWRASRLEHFQAMQSEAVQNAAKSHFERGARFGQRALEREANRVEGLFWCATCELEAARIGGKFAAARTLGSAQKKLERAAFLDESFHEAGPLRVLGRITHLKPLLLGGSLDRALSFYERALQIAPRNPATLIYFADALLFDRQPRRAREVLQSLLQLNREDDWHWELTRDQNLAHQWLQNRFS